jgi:glutathione S-transferase
MIVVHHLEASRSQRILWALEELGVPYELKVYKRNLFTKLADPALKEIHPLGKSPIVVDGDKTLVESGAVLEYLVETYGEGKFVPKRDTPEFLKYRFWMHYAEGSAMPPLLLKLIFARVKTKTPFLIRPIAKAIAVGVEKSFIDGQIATHFGYIEAELGKSTWFVGDELTAADFQMCYPVEGIFARSDGTERPNTKAWLDRVRARPAYQRALEKGGPVMIG